MNDDLPGSNGDNALARNIHKVGSKAHETVDRVESTAADAANTLGERADRVLQVPNRAYQATCDCITERPLQSVAIAAGVGLVIGWLCGRTGGYAPRY